ncbi:MAG: hypothetical protein ISS63_12810 [Desulfobacteraceae bacterium]|nr:hypothetical protein [Desulfobacteraceae bacterium]
MAEFSFTLKNSIRRMGAFTGSISIKFVKKIFSGTQDSTAQARVQTSRQTGPPQSPDLVCGIHTPIKGSATWRPERSFA